MPSQPTETYVDAKQRVVIASPVTASINGQAYTNLRYCAEPSPDALSAIATSGSGGLSVEQKVSLQAAFTMAETASNIGLRTQSIQLMRDAMYRLCEGVASGTLTSPQFETLYRHFQNSMVAILAIEQLTGTVRPPAAALNTTAGAGAAKEIAALTQNVVDAQTAYNTAAADAATKKAALDNANAATVAYLKSKNAATADALTADQKTEYAPLQQAVTDATTASTAADKTSTDAKTKLDTYQKGLDAIGSGNLSASATTTVQADAANTPLSGDAATAVANAVQQIVSQELNSGFFREACATLFVEEATNATTAAAAPKNSLEADCSAYAQATIADLTASSEAAKAIRDAAARLQVGQNTPAEDSKLKLAQLISELNSGQAQAALLSGHIDLDPTKLQIGPAITPDATPAAPLPKRAPRRRR